MRFRPVRAIFVSVLIAAMGCGSDDNPVTPPPPTAAPVWSEVTDLLPSTSLYGMWAPRTDFIVAVGRDGDIWQWDGMQWTERVSPTALDLYSIAGSVVGSVAVVGENGFVAEQVQGSFVVRTTPTQENLQGVWRASTGQFVAVGDYGTVIRGAGTSWSMDTTPTSSPLLSVWGAGDSDIFAVGGNGVILYYDGSQWSEMQSGTSEILSGVSGTSATDVYAAGTEGSILHYDGNGWTRVTTPSSGPLQSICASCGPMAAGANGDVVRMVNGTWQSDVLGGKPWLYATANAGTDLWAIGAHALFRHDGASWTGEARGAIPMLRSLTSTPELGLLLVGDGGATMQGGPGEWRYEDAGAVQRLNCVWVSPAGDVLAGGLNRIFRRTNSGWVIENQDVQEYFDIGGNDQFTFAVGSTGAIMRRGGTSWSLFQRLSSGGAVSDVHAIDMGGPTNYMAGENYLYRFNGSSNWDVSYTRVGTVFWDVMSINSAQWQAIAVGSGGLCVGRSIGAGNWTSIPTNVSSTLYSLAVGPGDDVYAVGAGGVVLRFIDGRWTTVTSPTSRTFVKAWSRGGALFACGGSTASGGILFRYGPPSP